VSRWVQSRRLRRAQRASAIPPIATGSLHCGDRRFGPRSAARTRSKNSQDRPEGRHRPADWGVIPSPHCSGQIPLGAGEMAIDTGRRQFIAALGGATVAWPLGAHAQQTAMPVVGFINGGAADAFKGRVAAFRKGLSETGYAEDQNVIIEYHWLEGHFERLPTVVADLVQRGVAVIATPGSTPASLAAKAATATIPIVFGVPGDPVALGLVASVARPGGNATGINFFAQEVNAKRLGLMHELLPKATRFAVMVNPANATSAEATSKALKEAGRALGREILLFNASTPAEIDAAFAAFARERVDALFIGGDDFFAGRQVQFATLASRDRIPGSFVTREMVEVGLLMSYGASVADMFRQVGIYSGSILKGTKPADLPVLQATKFEFAINLQTARALGIEVPPAVLSIADEVIE
jgi:putative ABC transport system substrate-binding protein